jgi:hypothetical protein
MDLNGSGVLGTWSDSGGLKRCNRTLLFGMGRCLGAENKQGNLEVVANWRIDT